MDIEAKNFHNRHILEAHIESISGRTESRKDEYRIVGTKEELRRLHLSHGKSCWGITVIATDTKEPQKPLRQIDRGKIHKPVQTPEVNIKKSKER